MFTFDFPSFLLFSFFFFSLHDAQLQDARVWEALTTGQERAMYSGNARFLPLDLLPVEIPMHVMSPICLLKHKDKCHDQRARERFLKHPRCLKAENLVGLKKDFPLVVSFL